MWVGEGGWKKVLKKLEAYDDEFFSLQDFVQTLPELSHRMDGSRFICYQIDAIRERVQEMQKLIEISFKDEIL